jgi:hypothetical protein
MRYAQTTKAALIAISKTADRSATGPVGISESRWELSAGWTLRRSTESGNRVWLIGYAY